MHVSNNTNMHYPITLSSNAYNCSNRRNNKLKLLHLYNYLDSIRSFSKNKYFARLEEFIHATCSWH